ncbi:hypothetical protein SERLA73DRAFT_154414 [Serpula lacrymans var. lacrymans S7.3]|uniref:Protein kinase domain-containing protein n=2 Tax=Serpula lacrymans var. lacrymans TaxID=341189 RepID=F8Q4L9_SERL3|nr:uncharacterized protein SERLADRAFT_410098 [Serpula lacrymans var. lacrymans S7.9]EGN97074.1 hypothetical protein SERLA73DRAFT_154414 [Serpula lacrymans var. lacrymans S7.3]EGO22676.1 hypothetical protein SERLADRAFT_410098 [Serpula lacrymans var. lacrymans S7.9]
MFVKWIGPLTVEHVHLEHDTNEEDRTLGITNRTNDIVNEGVRVQSNIAAWSQHIHKDRSQRLSGELVEGVAFLHEQRIAHLDIKPDNLICTFDTDRLLIIDFDIAMKCGSENDMVERSCGTFEWSAPEIVLDADKLPQAFSPIRADLWSCGRVLQFITGMVEKGSYSGFGQLIKMLLDRDPRRRPLLHSVVDKEWVSWTTNQLLEAFGCQASGNEIQETVPTRSV